MSSLVSGFSTSNILNTNEMTHTHGVLMSVVRSSRVGMFVDLNNPLVPKNVEGIMSGVVGRKRIGLVMSDKTGLARSLIRTFNKSRCHRRNGSSRRLGRRKVNHVTSVGINSSSFAVFRARVAGMFRGVTTGGGIVSVRRLLCRVNLLIRSRGSFVTGTTEGGIPVFTPKVVSSVVKLRL